jgi:hypothetical protein
MNKEIQKGDEKQEKLQKIHLRTCYATAYVTQYDLEITLLSIRRDCR